jgi:1L-myo-inositol 1-phosphate cytidylyltransferase / CDP-L-myo-inositol myo-inositolphosphotransferase
VSRPWVLVFGPPAGDPARRLGGLPLALRLALDAQRGGASAIVVFSDLDPRVSSALRDPRLKLPIVATAPDQALRVRVPASYLVHRDLLKAVVERYGADAGQSEIDLSQDFVALAVPFAFDPIDVRNLAASARAERLLFRSLRKAQDGWTSRWLNRPISLFLSRWLVKTKLLPNQLSLLILAIGLAGAALAARGGYFPALLGACLFHAQSVLDGCDGEISRVSYRGSLLGEWLDTIGDDLTNYAFFGGAAWGLFQTSGSGFYLALGAVGVGAGVIASGLEYRYLARIGSGDLLRYPLTRADAAGDASGLFEKIRPLFKRDTFVFLTLVAALLGALGVMVFLFAAGALGVLASVIAAELRMARERRGGGAPVP